MTDQATATKRLKGCEDSLDHFLQVRMPKTHYKGQNLVREVLTITVPATMKITIAALDANTTGLLTNGVARNIMLSTRRKIRSNLPRFVVISLPPPLKDIFNIALMPSGFGDIVTKSEKSFTSYGQPVF